MSSCRRWALRVLVVLLAGMTLESSADAYYNRRGYRRGRGYNGSASAQRAASALNAAQARVYAARANLARQTKLAKQQAESSAELATAKSDHAQSERDYQAARASVVEQLKKTNPQFSALLKETQSLRSQVAAAVKAGKAGKSNGNLRSLQMQLKEKTRRAIQIEDEALSADSGVKDARVQLATAHAAEADAAKEAKNAIAQDPNVQAAQKELNQANQQAAVAANRYNNTPTGNYGTGYGRRRGSVGYRGGYGYGRGYGYARAFKRGSRSSHVRYAHFRRR